ncbi:MAG: hypothetical protein KGH63_03415 [Candidatus Micrarchaeota archaeon]|nr:hypothetical protein [Candidatus Micrarchaeota archaeon]
MATKKMEAARHADRSMLDEKRMGIALGFGTAVGVGLLGISAGGMRTMMLTGTYDGFLGGAYGVPVLGILSAIIWGFVLGAITGYLTAWAYNRA